MRTPGLIRWAVVVLALVASCSKNDAADGNGGAGGGGAGGRGGSGTGTCTDTPFDCAYGSGHSCGDVLVPAFCTEGHWGCGAGQIRASECRCAGLSPAGCTCGDTGWVCPDGGAGGSSGGGGSAGGGGRGGNGGAPGVVCGAGRCDDGLVCCTGCDGTKSCNVGCLGVACPVPDAGVDGSGGGACASLTTQTACDARSDCHAVFFDPQTCGCASIGCCAHFDGCADGAKAVCAQPSTFVCKAAPPHCEGSYVIGYTATCYEGCVRTSQCP